MEHEDRERIKRVLELSERDHKMVKKMYSAMKWGRVLKIVYWIVIVGVAVGAFYFLQPFLESLADTYTSLENGVQSIRSSLYDAREGVENVRQHIPTE